MGLTRINNQALTDVTSAGLPSGSVVQVVTLNKTDITTMSSTSFATISNFTATITPKSASNKILVVVSINFGGGNNTYGVAQLMRDSSTIGRGPSDGSRVRGSFTLASNDQSRPSNSGISYLDSPSTTSAIDYSVQVQVNSGQSIKINTSNENENSSITGTRLMSTITLMEIAG